MYHYNSYLIICNSLFIFNIYNLYIKGQKILISPVSPLETATECRALSGMFSPVISFGLIGAISVILHDIRHFPEPPFHPEIE